MPRRDITGVDRSLATQAAATAPSLDQPSHVFPETGSPGTILRPDPATHLAAVTLAIDPVLIGTTSEESSSSTLVRDIRPSPPTARGAPDHSGSEMDVDDSAVAQGDIVANLRGNINDGDGDGADSSSGSTLAEVPIVASAEPLARKAAGKKRIRHRSGSDDDSEPGARGGLSPATSLGRRGAKGSRSLHI